MLVARTELARQHDSRPRSLVTPAPFDDQYATATAAMAVAGDYSCALNSPLAKSLLVERRTNMVATLQNSITADRGQPHDTAFCQRAISRILVIFESLHGFSSVWPKRIRSAKIAAFFRHLVPVFSQPENSRKADQGSHEEQSGGSVRRLTRGPEPFVPPPPEFATGPGAPSQRSTRFTKRFSLKRRNGSRTKPGLPRPHAHLIEPVLKTLAPAGEVK